MQTKKLPTRAIIDNWKRQMLLQEKLGQTVLKFMRHPDATREEVLDVQSRYRERYKQYVEMGDHLRKLWPYSRFPIRYPWERS